MIEITDEMVAHAWAGYEGNLSMREALEAAAPLIAAAARAEADEDSRQWDAAIVANRERDEA